MSRIPSLGHEQLHRMHVLVCLINLTQSVAGAGSKQHAQNVSEGAVTQPK